MALSTSRTVLTQTGINTFLNYDIGGLNSAGIATFSNFKTGTTDVHSVGVNAARWLLDQQSRQIQMELKLLV